MAPKTDFALAVGLDITCAVFGPHGPSQGWSKKWIKKRSGPGRGPGSIFYRFSMLFYMPFGISLELVFNTFILIFKVQKKV